MTRILILGGTRYLGKAIVEQITNDQYEIATLSRSEVKSDIKHFVCDRKNSSALKKILINFNPDIILDMVNFDSHDSHSISTFYEHGFISQLKHYIMISSFFVYNHFDYYLFSEKKLDEKFNINNIDGYTKRKIESEIRLYKSKLMNMTSILRLPFVFSADDYTNRFQHLCELSLDKNETIVKLLFKYSLVRKNDAAEAVIKILNSKPVGITDLSNEGYITNKKLLETVRGSEALVTGRRDYEIKSFPYFVKKDICLNSQKIKIDLPILKALKIEAKKYWLRRDTLK